MVIIEFNANFTTECVALKYDSEHRWTGDVAYGASFEAMRKLGKHKGYTLVEYVGHDLIFIKSDLVKDEIEIVHKQTLIHRQEGYERFIDV